MLYRYTFCSPPAQFQLSIKDLNLTEFRLDFLRIVCSHEHLVTLNLPLGAALYPAGPGSQHSSPSSESHDTHMTHCCCVASAVFDNLIADVSSVLLMFVV